MSETQSRPPANNRPPANAKPAPAAPATQEQLEKADRVDLVALRSMGMQPRGGGALFIPTSVGEVVELGRLMSTAKIAVRNHLRGNVGACVAVCMQAARWQMDPFAVANKSYAVNDQLAYEAQLIAAVVNTRAPIVGRLKTYFEGEGDNLVCYAWATLVGEDEPTVVKSPKFSRITPKNSPLWRSDPEQQMHYYTTRLWARRVCPEVLLGVYDVDELAEPPIERGEPEVLRPQRSDFRAARGPVTDVEADDPADLPGDGQARQAPTEPVERDEDEEGPDVQAEDDAATGASAAGGDDGNDEEAKSAGQPGEEPSEFGDPTFDRLLGGWQSAADACSTLAALDAIEDEWKSWRDDDAKKPPIERAPSLYIRRVNGVFLERKRSFQARRR